MFGTVNTRRRVECPSCAPAWIVALLAVLLSTLSCAPDEPSATPMPRPPSDPPSHSLPVVPAEAPVASPDLASPDLASPDLASPDSVSPTTQPVSRSIEQLSAGDEHADRGILADELRHGDQRGDWATEDFHVQAKQRLEPLKKMLRNGEATSADALRNLTTTDFVTTPLCYPDDALQSVYADANFTVYRPVEDAESLAPMEGHDGLREAVDMLRGEFSAGGVVDVHFKIYRVTQDGDRAELEMVVDTDGRRASAANTVAESMENGDSVVRGGLQQTSVWRSTWRREESAGWRLARIELADYEEVHYRTADGKLFADCTQSVLGGNECFGRQIKKSVDHWRLHLEARHGIDAASLAGLAVADVNGDDLDDLYFCEVGGLPNRLFLQQPDGTAEDVSVSAGVDWLDRSHGALFADLDNDGDQDLIVSTGASLMIMSNNGKGQFQVANRLATEPTPYSLAVTDYDNDGLLDVYVCAYGSNYETFAEQQTPIPWHDANNGVPNTLLRNTGDLQFKNMTVEVGLDQNNRRYSFSASWQDFDQDGDADLYVANDFGRNNLYVNRINEDGRFHDLAAEYGVEDIGPGMSVAWGDYDRDGWVDLYVGNMFSAAGNRIAYQSRFHRGANDETVDQYRRFARGNTLLKNQGGRHFVDVSQAANVSLGRWAWSSLFADINNDGWLDLLVANGNVTGVQPDDL